MRKVGRFTVNEKLTKALDMDGWVIYRDPKAGLYALNEEMGIDNWLGYWAASQITDLDRFVRNVRAELIYLTEEVEEL